MDSVNSFRRAIDLHVHSTFSDGSKTPAELIDMAIDKHLFAFALTDHDTVAGFSEIQDILSKKQITPEILQVIPGVEISTDFNSKEIHIVGLFVDTKNPELISFLKHQEAAREIRNQKICDNFNKIGIDISYNEMRKAYGNAILTRAHFADMLVKKHLVGDRNEVFGRYLGDGKPCYEPVSRVSSMDAIKYIHRAGGVAVLAHPVLYHLGKSQMNILLDVLCASGLDAIEALYSTYKLGDELEIKKIAKERNLLLSGGSDYHGDNKPDIQLGTGKGHLFIHREILVPLYNRHLYYKAHPSIAITSYSDQIN